MYGCEEAIQSRLDAGSETDKFGSKLIDHGHQPESVGELLPTPNKRHIDTDSAIRTDDTPATAPMLPPFEPVAEDSKSLDTMAGIVYTGTVPIHQHDCKTLRIE